MSSLQRTIGRNVYRNQPGFAEWKHARKIAYKAHVKAEKAKKYAELLKKKSKIASVVKTVKRYQPKPSVFARFVRFIRNLFTKKEK